MYFKFNDGSILIIPHIQDLIYCELNSSCCKQFVSIIINFIWIAEMLAQCTIILQETLHWFSQDFVA